jgi:hypothetical protein
MEILLLLVLLAGWAVISGRLRKINRRIEYLVCSEQVNDTNIRNLVSRVEDLEKTIERVMAAPSSPVEAPAVEQTRPPSVRPERPLAEAILIQTVPSESDIRRQQAEQRLPQTNRTATHTPSSAEWSRPVAIAPEIAKSSLLATWRQRIHKQMAGEEWEAVVGGSWFNKLGVLVLVMGIALFIGYSLTHLGPAGRIAIGFLVSGAMLGGGIILERQARYVIFARGLIGGGWAGLYFTTYAMHGLEAARIIQSPLVGMTLLGTAAAGMILHSLHYRSQVVTGLAYFVGYVTLAISPLSNFSIVASVPLAGSLLFVAQRFSWAPMAAVGVVVTYGTYAVRAESATGSSFADFVSGQSVLAIYWLLFEVFDILNVGKRRSDRGVASAIFPLNACGFIGVSLLQWSSVTPTTLYLFFATTSAAYLASTIARARLQPPSGFSNDSDTLTRIQFGSYEGAVTVAVALMTPGIFLRFSGLDVNIALLLQAEFLFLAGLYLSQPYLRALGAAAIVIPLIKLVLVDITKGGYLTIMGLNVMAWTPMALLTASVFYLNRGLIRPERESPLLFPELGYSYSASTLLAVIIGFEISRDYLGLGWLMLAFPLFEVGLRRRLEEFRLQSYGVAALGLAALLIVNILGGSTDPWVSIGTAALLTYAAATRLFRLAPDRLPEQERLTAQEISSVAGTTLLAALLWYVLPKPAVAVGWSVLSLLLIELGFALPFPILRFQGNLLGALAFARLFFANFTGIGETGGVSHRILTVFPLIVLFYYLSGRLRVEEEHGRLMSWERGLSRLYLYAPAILAVFLIRFELGRVLAVVGWALFGLGLLFLGLRRNNRDLRWQSYVLALLAFVRSWATNFYIPESLAGMFDRVFTGAVVIGSFYAAQFLSPRRRAGAILIGGNWFSRLIIQFDTNARAIFSVLATTLLTVLLFYEVSGRLLTVAWGLEGVALMAAGFPMRERIFRLSGLLLLMTCILKLFAYDLRELDTPYRILSFIVLGFLLLGVSWIYTRFRDQIRRYL